MALKFHPSPGTILICDFGTGFRSPEMVKRRPVIVVSPRLRNRSDLCTVVPLSTRDPIPPEKYHFKLPFPRPLPSPFDSPEMWVKCDMIYTVGFQRLELIRLSRDPATGKRKYIQKEISKEELFEIRKGIKAALGIK